MKYKLSSKCDGAVRFSLGPYYKIEINQNLLAGCNEIIPHPQKWLNLCVVI